MLLTFVLARVVQPSTCCSGSHPPEPASRCESSCIAPSEAHETHTCRYQYPGFSRVLDCSSFGSLAIESRRHDHSTARANIWQRTGGISRSGTGLLVCSATRKFATQKTIDCSFETSVLTVTVATIGLAVSARGYAKPTENLPAVSLL